MQVSETAEEIGQITQSQQWGKQISKSGQLETVGDKDGETTDILKLEKGIPAECVTMQLSRFQIKKIMPKMIIDINYIIRVSDILITLLSMGMSMSNP